MTDSERIIIDTNVILDVTGEDPSWAEWSKEQAGRLVGRLTINPIIYAELCYEAGRVEDVEAVLFSLGLAYSEFPREALFLASQAFKSYRKRGGNMTAPLADFFIGAHASALGTPILTRDAGRYLTYFPDVTLITP